MALCFDAVMNVVLLDSFNTDSLKDSIYRSMIFIGRFSIGWFVFYGEVYPWLKNKMWPTDENK